LSLEGPPGIAILARIILLAAIGFVVWLLFRGFFRAQAKDAQPPATAKDAEDMVACARCGVNMPKSEATETGGVFTCRDPSTCKHAG
jgi:uncharacterized protein